MKFKIKVGRLIDLTIDLDKKDGKTFSWIKVTGGVISVALIGGTAASLGYGMVTGDYVPFKAITDYIKELVGVIVKNTS